MTGMYWREGELLVCIEGLLTPDIETTSWQEDFAGEFTGKKKTS